MIYHFRRIFISLLLGIFIFFNSPHLQATIYNELNSPIISDIDSPSTASSTHKFDFSKFFVSFSMSPLMSFHSGVGYQFNPSFSIETQFGFTLDLCHFSSEEYTPRNTYRWLHSLAVYEAWNLRFLPTFYFPTKQIGKQYFATLGISYSQLSSSLLPKNWHINNNPESTIRILEETRKASTSGVLLYPKIGIVYPSALGRFQTRFSLGALLLTYRENTMPNRFVQIETANSSQTQYLNLNPSIIPNWLAFEFQAVGKFF